MVGPCSSEPLPFQASHWKCCHSSSSSVAKRYGNPHTALSPILSWKSLSHTPLEPILIWSGVCVCKGDCEFRMGEMGQKWWTAELWGPRAAEHVRPAQHVHRCLGSQLSQSGGKVQPEPALPLRGDRKEFFIWPSGRREGLTPVSSTGQENAFSFFL